MCGFCFTPPKESSELSELQKPHHKMSTHTSVYIGVRYMLEVDMTMNNVHQVIIRIKILVISFSVLARSMMAKTLGSPSQASTAYSFVRSKFM